MPGPLTRRSERIEERQGAGSGPRPSGRGWRFAGGVGLLLLGLVGLVFAIDSALVQRDLLRDAPDTAAVDQNPPDDARVRIISVVLAESTDVWHRVFDALGGLYAEPRLVLFEDGVQSACGLAGVVSGPFYCAADRTLYIDLGFFEALGRSDTSGEFDQAPAQAYAVAHMVGHHVQMLMGIAQEVEQMRQQLTESEEQRLSLIVELQADCFAGLWAGQTDEAKRILGVANIDEAVEAAAAISRQRKQDGGTPGRVSPESFTHGSAEQRARWFRTGFEAGNVDACDTFRSQQL